MIHHVCVDQYAFNTLIRAHTCLHALLMSARKHSYECAGSSVHMYDRQTDRQVLVIIFTFYIGRFTLERREASIFETHFFSYVFVSKYIYAVTASFCMLSSI